MTTFTKIPYDDARDFTRVRDLLVDNYRRTGEARSWMIDRWEFCRSFAQTMMETAVVWPSTVGLWVDNAGEIAAVAASEGEGRGEAHFFFNRSGPVSPGLVDELFRHVDQHLAVSVPGAPSLQLRIWQGYPDLEAEAVRRGLKQVWTEVMSHKTIDPAENSSLPEGYRLAWGTLVSDEDKGAAHIGAFGYAGQPAASRTPGCWEALRAMPDWRHELELFAVAPDGTVAAFVNLWLDAVNRLAVCEPVGTLPGHRRLGLARALIAEGGRRAWVLGARELLVGSDQPFYQACGFVPQERHGVWQR